MRANQTRVLRAAIDGRTIETTRYRRSANSWQLDYIAPSDFGATLTLPSHSGLSLDLTSRSPGVPELNGIRIPPVRRTSSPRRTETSLWCIGRFALNRLIQKLRATRIRRQVP
jgi:hypothetical protein